MAVDSRSRFVRLVSSMTGLDYRVVYAWTLAEESKGLQPPGAHNWLNLRTGTRTKGYSGVPVSPAGAGFASFRSVDDAAAEAAYWITKMPNYRAIKQSAGRPPAVQLKAIIASPWAGGHYNGGRSLLGAFKSAPPGPGSSATPVASILPYPPYFDPTGKLPGGTDLPDVPWNKVPVVGGVAEAISGATEGLLAGFLRLLLAGLILALAAALFYNGVRRLSGDRLPSPQQMAETAAMAAK